MIERRSGPALRLLLLAACATGLLVVAAAPPSLPGTAAPARGRTAGAAGVVGVVGDWPAYGGNAGGTHYSPLAQITPANVASLRVAWSFRTGELGEGVKDWDRSAFEATPILYQGTLYFTTPATNVIALDAATGALRWRHESQNRNDLHYSDGVSRGASLWVDAASEPGAACHARIYANTLDGRLLALDAADGKPCAGFGEQGRVDLLAGIRSQFQPGDEWRDYLVTSPPAILDDKVIVGSAIGDNRAVLEELGTVRAFDARSGQLAWSWDPIPRDPSNPVYAEWDPARVANASAANAWAPLSVDPQRHLVFVPTGSASPDFFGGERPGDNRWANSVVALDGETGALRWGQQLVHHDLWDYDLASQPTVVELRHDGRTVPAIIQATKTGLLFTFNRETGEPLFPIVERPVPQDAVPGERPSPTQPFPLAPPALVRQAPVRADDAWGIAGLDAAACRRRIAAYRSEGIFQPPSTRDSLMQPGNAGGINWGGVAFDGPRQLAFTFSMNLPMVVTLVPRAQLRAQRDSPAYDGFEFARQEGTPYGMRRQVFKSALGIPCVRPPWGQLTAVDMEHGTIRWQVPLGDTPFIPLTVGMPGLGGPIVTASGLVFIGAAFDDRLRAIDAQSGAKLWEAHLPAGAQATPMTYAIDGRQYLVIAAGGYKGDSRRGDYVIAYALPR